MIYGLNFRYFIISHHASQDFCIFCLTVVFPNLFLTTFYQFKLAVVAYLASFDNLLDNLCLLVLLICYVMAKLLFQQPFIILSVTSSSSTFA